MNSMQEFVVYGFAWCLWIGGVLGILIDQVYQQNRWKEIRHD